MASGACGGDREDYAIEGRFCVAAAAAETQDEEAAPAVETGRSRKITLWDFSSSPRYLGYITAENLALSFFSAGRVLGEDGGNGCADGSFSAVGGFDGAHLSRGRHRNAGHAGGGSAGGDVSSSSSGLPEGKKRNRSDALHEMPVLGKRCGAVGLHV